VSQKSSHPPNLVHFSIAEIRAPLYLRQWDTLPQRRAHICEDTSNGYDETGNAAGKSAFFFWPLCQTPRLETRCIA
jgi:hypothetical protein